MAGYSQALEDWETNLRLFTPAGGAAPTGDAERLAFVKLLPPDVAAHVTLHLDLPAYREFSALKKSASKYVKVMTGLQEARKRQRRPDHLKLVDARDHDDHSDSDDHNDNNEDNESHNDNNDDGFSIPGF